MYRSGRLASNKTHAKICVAFAYLHAMSARMASAWRGARRLASSTRPLFSLSLSRPRVVPRWQRLLSLGPAARRVARQAGKMVRHNNVIPNAHFRKQWDVRARGTHAHASVHQHSCGRRHIDATRACGSSLPCATVLVQRHGRRFAWVAPKMGGWITGADTTHVCRDTCHAQVRVRTWFSQPARKRSRREGAAWGLASAQCHALAPRWPVGRLQP